LQAAHSSQRGKEILAHWLALLDFLSKGIIAGKQIDFCSISRGLYYMRTHLEGMRESLEAKLVDRVGSTVL
jgi:hypothetical protein